MATAALSLGATSAPSTYPLSSTDLVRYAALAAQGGIGRATALRDYEALGPSDLMFLEGDSIILLRQVDVDRYLGSCEEIIGCFPAEAVRVETTTLNGPTSPPTGLSPAAPTSSSPKEQHSSTSTAAEPPSAPHLRRPESLKVADSSISDLAERTRRRRMNVAGLGIDDGPSSPKLFWSELETRGEAAELPGTFIPFPHSPSCSSPNTPQLLTSPSSDFGGSSNDHDAVATPPPSAWTPSVACEEEATARYSDPSPKSSDEPTDNFPIIHNFPLPTSHDLLPTQPTPLRSQFSDASLSTTAGRLKLSDAAGVESLPRLPSVFPSPSSVQQPPLHRVPKASDASWTSSDSDGIVSGPTTPGAEDLTFNLIFDSYYRYSTASMATVDGGRPSVLTSGPGTGNDAETEQDEVDEDEEEELSQLDSPVEQIVAEVGQGRQPFRFGAASTLRMEALTGKSGRSRQEELQLPPRPPRFSTDSFDVNTIPRLSTIFPRSSTADSLASISTSRSAHSSSTSESIPIENPVAELDAARRLFDAHFTTHESAPVSDLPDSPTRTRSAGARRKSIKGLAISSPVSAVSAANRPAWRATASDSPVGADLNDVFSDPDTPSSSSHQSSPSSADPPRVTVYGASPSHPNRRLDYYDDTSAGQLRGQWRTKLTLASSDGEPAQYALHPGSASPSSQLLQSATDFSAPPSPAFSMQSASSASSPSASLFTEEWRMSRRLEPTSPQQPPTSSSAKLRKPNLRLKTQPGPQQISAPVEMARSPSLSSSSTHDAFLSSPRPPPAPSQAPYSPPRSTAAYHPPQAPRQLKHKTSRGLLTRKLSGRGEAAVPSPPASVALPANKGISSKDFEDETVKVNGGEFEIVKPLMSALRRPSFASSRPSVDDFGGSSEGGHTVEAKSPGGSYSSHGLELSHGLDETSVENHRAKELAWVKALGSGMSVKAMRKSGKIRALVHAEIPSSLRGKVWTLLSGASEVKVDGVYRTLCDSPRQALDDQIEHDVERTLRRHPQFLPVAQELASVVKAFARYRADLGYSPSAASLAGLILTQVADGESSFWTLVALVKNFGLAQFFPTGRDECRISTLAFAFIIEQADPKLARRLIDLNVDPTSFFPRWLSTLFVDTLPWASILPIVDLILYDPALQLRTALAVLELSHLDEPANFPTRESVLHWLLNLPPPSFAPTLLLPTLHTIKLREDRVAKAVKRAEALIRKSGSK